MRLAVLLAAACTSPSAVSLPDAPPASQPDARVSSLPDARVSPSFDAPPPDAAALLPRYTTTADHPHAPITQAVAQNLRTIAQRNGAALHDDVFMKVGDSITVAPQFLACFDLASADLGVDAALQDVLHFFQGGDADGTDPFARVSLAATVGWSADAALAGDPSPLDQEEGLTMPRYAVVMFGSNDVVARSIYQYEANLLTIVDDLVGGGVIPILSSIPPQTQSATGTANVPRYNAVSRGIASARLIPYIDYNLLMAAAPGFGLGPDGLHPNSYMGGCVLTAAGLMYGYNIRNRLTLEALARVKSVVEGDPPPDPEPSVPAVTGEGSYDKPFVIYGFPFTDLRDTSRSTNTRFTKYTGCSAAQDESGPEYIYSLTVSSPIKVHAYVMVRDIVDIDVHLLSELDVADCVQRNDKEIVATLTPGTWYFSLDTYVPADGTPRSGEYLFVLLSE